jgi:hypothetical protein
MDVNVLEHPLDAVYVYVVPWSGFPVVPPYPPPPLAAQPWSREGAGEGFRVWGWFLFCVWGVRCGVGGVGCGVWGVGCGVWGAGFGVWG